MSIEHVECDGTVALARLEELRGLYPSTKRYPFIIGGEEELERLSEVMEFDERRPADIVAESLSVDVPAWFEERESEARQGWFKEEYVTGEWPGEAQEKDGIKAHLDLLTRAVRPLVYIGVVNVERPWMLPAEAKYGGWNECPDAAVQCAIMRYWGEKHGAEIVSLAGDFIEFVVREPPRTAKDSIKLAWEQYWYCNDIVDQGMQTVNNLAAGLMNSDYWFFWWD